MRNWAWLFLLGASLAGAADELRTVSGLANPESVLVGPDGRIYVSQIGEFDKKGDGSIVVITDDGKIEPFSTSALNDPKGLTSYKKYLFVADRDHVYKFNYRGRLTEQATSSEFPVEPQFLNDVAADENGNVYVSDSGDIENGGGGAIFKVSPLGKITLVANGEQDARIRNPNGLLLEDKDHLLVVDMSTGDLLRVSLQPVSVEKIAGGFGVGDGLARDKNGVLYISDFKGGRVWSMDMNQQPLTPRLYDHKFQSAADISLSADEQFILVPDMKAGTITWLPVKH